MNHDNFKKCLGIVTKSDVHYSTHCKFCMATFINNVYILIILGALKFIMPILQNPTMNQGTGNLFRYFC
jgi:hypothetical protein